MALPTADPTLAALPASRRWRPGVVLGLAAVVLWGHWSLIERLAPAAPRAGSLVRPAAALQVRRVMVTAPELARVAAPVVARAVTTVTNQPVVPARRPVVSPAKPPVTPPSTARPDANLAVAPAEPAARVDAESPSTVAAEATASPEGALPPPVYATRLPPPAQLRYALRYNGQAGEALLTWRHDGERYTLALDGRGGAGDRPLVAQTSQGGLGATGLAPERHLDRRRGGRQQAANFRRDIGRIGFSGPTVGYPAWLGAQDRLSWLAQLAAILDAGHASDEVQLFVVDAQGSGGLWRLQRQGDERLVAPVGEVMTQLWQREPPRPEGLRVQAWLDPARGHWPVQLRFTAQRSGDVFELRLLAEPQPPP